MSCSPRILLTVVLTSGVIGGLAASGCKGSDDSQFPPKGGDDEDGGASGSFGDGGLGSDVKECVNLCKQQVTCSGGGTTSISGTVYDPAGKTPLYNVVVYVPNAPVEPIATGATCEKCESTVSGDPIAATLSDTKGQFKLTNVPVGDNIPIVFQIGKWRRQVTIPKVAPCIDTPLTDRNMTRLPAKKSEGNIPKIALTTGDADALECLLRKIGIDDSEITPETGNGRVNFYSGATGAKKYAPSLNGGVSFTASKNFWNDVDNLKKYDLVLLSCEGGVHDQTKQPPAPKAMQDYSSAGGRVFASHWHNYWLTRGPAPFPTVATFVAGQPDLGNVTEDIDQSFPKGKALAEWLVNVDGTAPLGKLPVTAAQHTVDAVNPAAAQRWVYTQAPLAPSVQYLSLNTPVGVPPSNQCGRFVLSDIHVSSGDKSEEDKPFPGGCTTKDLSPQEKTLEFMLFDLSSCIQQDSEAPKPPPVK